MRKNRNRNNSAPRLSERRNRRKKRTSKSLPVIATCLLIFTLVFVGFLMSTPDVNTNTPTLCPEVRPRTTGLVSLFHPAPQSTTISILFDTTSEIGSVAKDEVMNRISEEVDRAATHDRIRLYQVNHTYQNSLEPIFDFCKPGPNSNQADRISDYMLTEFTQTLNNKINDQDYNLPTSPIIEALSSVAVNFPMDGTDKKIILVSDLVENSELLNQYNPNWLNEADNKAILLNSVPPLNNINLRILYIAKINEPEISVQSNNNHVTWWYTYLLSPETSEVEKPIINIERINSG